MERTHLAFLQKILGQGTDGQVGFDEPRPRHVLAVLEGVVHEQDDGVLVQWDVRA